MNRRFYVTMQGPSEMGASGRLVNWDRFDDLKRIQVPTLVISGKYDTMDPAYMAAMAKQLPHGELAATNGGHMAMYDDQPTYFAKLLAFLRKLKSWISPLVCGVIRSRKRRAQSAIPRCSLRSRARLPASTSRVMTEPAPTIAPSPMLTGATNALFEPMKASAPISVRYFPKPS